jgi:hypothetical protein
MIRSLLRILGLVFLAAGFVFVIYDGTKSIADHTFYVSKFSMTWAEIHQSSLQSLQAAVEKNLTWLWNPILQAVLEQPTWLVLGMLGIILILLGRKKKPLIGYARY